MGRIGQCLVWVFLLIAHAAVAESWVEDTFEDFADGTLDAGGQNIYVAHDGSVRTIHRFDINHDSYIDLLLNCTHDLIGILPSTVGWVTPALEVRHAPLAVEGSLAVAQGDLNRDGFTDLVFCPNRQGIQNPRRFVTIIYGGADGWPASRSNGVLPVSDATAVAVCDLNHDKWPDIAALNGLAWLPGQSDGRIVRVFWGGEHGYLLSNYYDFGVKNALDMTGGDLDEDGAGDLAILTADHTVEVVLRVTGNHRDSTAVVLPGSDAQCLATADVNDDGQLDLVLGASGAHVYMVAGKPGPLWEEPVTLDAPTASQVTAGDLDQDGHCDLVLTQVAIAHASGGEATGADKDKAGHVSVLWGSADGFDKQRGTQLRVPHATATATAAGDLDADGRTDLVVAVYQGGETFSVDAPNFFGNGSHNLAPDQRGIPVSAATDVMIVPAEKGLPARAVFCNSAGGTVNERVPSYLYYGGADGFSEARRVLIPFVSGYEASAADLNLDGWTDVIAMCSGHLGPGAQSLVELGANIFWGKRDGIDITEKPAVLREYNLFSSNVADFDKNGYLDLALGAFDPPPSGGPDVLALYYGGKDGYNAERRVALPSPGRSAICVVADFNRDAWLDIAVTSYNTDLIRIFWGGTEGFSEARQAQLSAPQPIELETADLNADGFLDLIAGSYNDKVALHFDTGSLLFWGAEDGFHEWNAQWLPGNAPVGTTVADFDADGYLDIFSSHYHGDLTRENLPSYLYWGSAAGFDTRTRTTLVCDSPSDGLAADFDQDGKLDLAVSCHTRDGNHAANSKVFYNDGNRFANPRVTLLPAVGPHWMWTEDIGHIYDRGWEQTYASSIHTWNKNHAGGILSAEADVPQGATLLFEVCSATGADELEKATWNPVEGNAFKVASGDRAMQYRAVFRSDNGDRFAVLHRVAVELTP
ncbi:MAG: VCBS repeat-containing protein [Candidatus Hydrogenedentes bacterium]|nr:VCBS repeat-containing protein [Candidatus Hydrogenedentota bacterium]